MEFTPEEVAKLPKWAQSKVNVLQMRLRESKEELTRIKANKPSDTIVGFKSSHEKEPVQYLKNGQLITFMINNNYFMVKVKNNSLDIMGNISILIIPKASNTCEIKFNP